MARSTAWPFAVAAAVEVATGLALLIAPDLVARLLLGTGLDATESVIARLAGAGLLGFGFACWPRRAANAAVWRRALWLYQPAATLGLILLGLFSGPGGVLLWPAAAYHAVATLLLGRNLRARVR